MNDRITLTMQDILEKELLEDIDFKKLINF